LVVEQQGRWPRGKTINSEDPMNVFAFRRLLLAQRLENFRARIGEVPAESNEEMTFAVAELTRNILALFGVDAAVHDQTPVENLDGAVQSLRGDLPFVSEETSLETLDQIGSAVREMFAGLKAARASK
jgi:hypothetical protein